MGSSTLIRSSPPTARSRPLRSLRSVGPGETGRSSGSTDSPAAIPGRTMPGSRGHFQLLNTLTIGRDTRTGTARRTRRTHANRKFETPAMIATYRLGGVGAASSAQPVRPTSGPWSLIGTHSDEAMRRPNPQIADGRCPAPSAARTTPGRQRRQSRTRRRQARCRPRSTGKRHFAQVTIDGQLGFPTFGLGALSLRRPRDPHPGRDRAPAALGLTSAGRGRWPPSSRCSHSEAMNYLVPREPVRDPIPAVQLAGSRIPDRDLPAHHGLSRTRGALAFTQIVGVRLSVTVVRAEALRDPRNGRWKSTQAVAGALAGIFFSRQIGQSRPCAWPYTSRA